MILDRRIREGMLLVALAATGYSLFPVLVNYISAAGLPAVDLATWRFIIAVPLLWLVLGLRRNPPAPGRIPRLPLVASGVLMTGAAVTAMLGLERLPASIFILIFYTYPAMVALIGLLRGDRLGRLEWIALVMTLIGLAIIAVATPGEPVGEQKAVTLDGSLLAFANAVIVAIHFTVTSILLRGTTDTPRASAFSLLGALVPLLLIIPFRPLVPPPDLTSWGLLAALALVSTVIASTALNAGIQRLGAPRAAIVSTMEPILTITWSVLLLGERLIPAQLVGGAFILGSVILLQLRNVQTARSGAPVLRAEEPGGV